MPDFFLRGGQPEGGPAKPANERIPPTFALEPNASPVRLDAASTASPPSVAAPEGSFPLFAADLPAGPDTLGKAPMLTPLAELIAHRRTTPPMSVGLFGRPGSGKSFALAQLLDRVARLAAASARRAKSPFLSRIATVRISAAPSAGEPATAIAADIFRTLNSARAGAETYAALAQDAAHAVRDPHVVARQANERLTEARNRLHAEREVLHDLDARRAKLVETVLYESAGSHIETYARVNRARIEARLRGFGLSEGDPLGTFRDLVRDAAEADVASNRIAAFFRALWAYRGQTRLLVAAVILLGLAWGFARAETTQHVWLPWLSGIGGFATTIAKWIAAHIGWFATAGTLAIVAACLAVLACLWRALRFTQPILRGAALLELDLASRRRDLDGLIANQTRRVDAITAEVDAHALRAQDAERRASVADEGATSPTAPLLDSLFEGAQHDGDEGARLAMAFTGSLDAAIGRGANSTFIVPQRILVAIDDLDTLSPARAASFIEAAHRLLSAPSFVLLFAADPVRLAAAWGEADFKDRLDKYVQVPLQIEAIGRNGFGALIRSLTGAATAENAQSPELDASQSVLDRPWRSGEADLLAALAPLAGHSPRTITRFINIYRLARAQDDNYPGLALLLALEAGGSDAERRAMAAALAEPDPAVAIHFADQPRLTEALEACRAARGEPLHVGDLSAARTIAAAYSR